MGSLDKPQHEPFRKCPNACTWSLSASLKQFFFFTICLTFQTNTMELRFHFSHYIYYKLGVQFEHLSSGTRADFNQYPSLPKLAEMLLQCYLKAYSGEEIIITLKYNSNGPHLVSFLLFLSLIFFSLPLTYFSFLFYFLNRFYLLSLSSTFLFLFIFL